MISTDAFRTADSGSDYFETEIHYRALAERIVVEVQDARRFIVVTGDPPPDPSRLSASLNAVLVRQHPVTALFSAAELLHVGRGPLAASKGASDSQAAVSRPLLFIINNAARLADHQIEYIYEKSQSDDRHIVVLLGRSDFLACHDRCKFLLTRDERIRCLGLHDLGRQEILQFIRHQVGTGETDRAFTDDVVAALWSQSRGDPRIVNGLARRLLDGLTNTDRPDLGVPPSPAPDPAREASGQAPLANTEAPAAPAEASLSEPDAAAGPSYPAAGRPSADGQSAWRLRNTNTETAPVAVFPASSLQCELPTRAAWDRPTGPSPASPLNGAKDPRSDEATGTDARTAISLPAIQDATGLVPAWPSSVPSLASPAARASLLPGWWSHATILSWPIIATVLCLVGVGLVGTVVLNMRGHPTGPTQSDVVPSPSPSPEAVSSTAPKPLGAPLATAEPEAGAIPVPLPPAPSSPPVDVATPPKAALSPGPTPTSPSPPAAALVVGLVERGDMLFSTGDMAAARLFYERAANVGDAQAALRLGESFDPNFLQAHARGVKGDPVTAISWYRRARELGSADAEILLKSLEGN